MLVRVAARAIDAALQGHVSSCSSHSSGWLAAVLLIAKQVRWRNPSFVRVFPVSWDLSLRALPRPPELSAKKSFAAYAILCNLDLRLRLLPFVGPNARQKLGSTRRSRATRTMRRLLGALLLAAGAGGFMSGRSSRPALTRRFAEPKRKPGQRGSARAKERLRKALEKEGVSPSTPAHERLRERQSPNKNRALHAIDAYPTHRSIHAQAKRWPKSAARPPRRPSRPQQPYRQE